MSNILKPLVEILHWLLMLIHDWLSSIGLSEDWTWGLAIIGITIVVRLIMFPLTWKQYKSSRAMQALAPQIKALQKKHKGDRATLQQETMRLYQENRVNPFASCLPLILQLPVFFALYYTLKTPPPDYLPAADAEALANASFLWLPKLGEPDPYYILLIVYIVTQLISTELMLTPQTDKSQKMLMRGMPIMFVFFLKGFPSGLFVYWVTTNLWTIGQQLIIRKTMPIVALEAAAGSSGGGGGKSGKAGPPPKKRGKFMDAMMAAQEQRHTQLEERRKAAKGGGKDDASETEGAAGAGAAKGGSSSKSGGKKGGKRPPPGKGARAKPKPVEPEPDIDEDDDKPPYR
jgi:YidC/Oxa1 family membrane protein insertase